jgi:hypothetical protein
VRIEFLEPAEYQRRLRADWLDVSDDERKEAEYQQELLDVFGLTATYNLLADRGAIESLASLGFYSPNSDSIVVRGQGMTPGVETTVVHELTHALQAQHFGVGDRIADRSTRSIAEADAMEVEQAYLNSLPAEAKWTAVEETKMTAEDEQLLAKVPATLVELEYAPYRLGRLAMDRRQTGGNSGINEALSNPPSEKQMIAPWAAAGGDFASTVTWWSAAMGAPVTPKVDGNDVTFALCARGKGAPEPPKAVVPTTVAVEVELSVVPPELIPSPGVSPQAVIIQPGQAAPTAGLSDYLCVARTIVDDPKAAPLITLPLPTATQQAAIDQRLKAAINHCLH